MLFGSPWMLLGLACAAIPVLIHLLSRRRHRREPWAAMRFLRAALDRRAKQLRLESVLLLVVRTLLVTLIVLAVAEPLFYAGDGRPMRESVRRVLILDLSASMGRIVSGESPMEAARREIGSLLDQSLPGDSFQLVRIAATSPRALIRRATYDPDEVRAELAAWKVTEERGDVAGSLLAAVELLREPGDDAVPEVVILSDLQRSNWWPEEAATRTQVQRLLAELSRRAKLKIVDLSGGAGSNVGLIALESAQPVASPEQELELTASVRNFSRADTTVSVEWRIDGRVLDSEVVPVRGGSEAVSRVRVPVQAEDALRVEARLIGEDALDIDNRRYAAVPVRDELRVLLVDGRPGLRPIDGAAGYAALALAPPPSTGAGLSRRIPIRAETISDVELGTHDLAPYDCIWLCDVAQIEPDQQRRLSRYVERGGGLIVAVGEQTRPEAWNAWRTGDGAPLLPAMLEEPQNAGADEADSVTFDPGLTPHPVMAGFAGNPDAGLSTTRIQRYFSAQPSLESAARRVVSFSNGDPAILEHSVGQGRVALVLIPVDDHWSNWAVWPSFLPMVHELTVFAAAGGSGQTSLLAGDAIESLLSAARNDVEASLIAPDGARYAARPRCDASACRLRFEATTASGIYQLEIGAPIELRRAIAVNVDPRESQSATIDESVLTREILPKLRFTYAARWSSLGASAASPAARGSLAGTLLAAALAFLIIEHLMAWRSRWGLAALVGLGVLTATAQAARWNPWAALALVVLLASGGLILRQRLAPVEPRRIQTGAKR